MGYTPIEFQKTLLGQFSLKTDYRCVEKAKGYWQIHSSKADFLVEITIKELAPRKIAMLTLPVLETNFQFKQATQQQQDTFLATFFKYFHKGGG